MKNSSDAEFTQFADMDFSNALPVNQVPALAAIQARQGKKSRITMRVDNTTLTVFRVQAEMTGTSYQTLMNDALAQFAQGKTLVDVVRETIRQELKAHQVHAA
jgi:predicted DNA binding CopG/RHH family protein